MPAIQYADKVFLDGRGYRQEYIDLLSEHYGEEARKTWEEKIEGFGSPKFDWARTTGRDDLILPDSWSGVLKKPDGSYKKCILYMTSVSTYLNNNILKKVRGALEAFKEVSADIALIWRPHPLMEDTLKSMRPSMYQEYGDIVRSYKDGAWGIYDTSSDQDRAIAVSDVTYGDMSSMINLVYEAGKEFYREDTGDPDSKELKDLIGKLENGELSTGRVRAGVIGKRVWDVMKALF